MSEPSTLFGQFHLKKDQLQLFLDSPAKNVTDFDDWIDWLNQKKKIHEQPSKLIRDLAANPIDFAQKKLGTEHFRYDDKNKILTLDNLYLSESYEVFLKVVAYWRGIERYITPESTNNFLIIYPFWWGDNFTSLTPEIDVYVEFINGQSRLSHLADRENIKIARSFLTEHGDALAREYYNKYGNL